MSYHLGEFEPRIDGILYDDMWEIKDRATRLAYAARGVAWETRFDIDASTFVGCVVASCREEAEKIADARGLGEKVIGPWIEAELPWNEAD